MPDLLSKSVSYYTSKMDSGDYFSLAGYSDAEWLSILGIRLGNRTGFGQLLDQTVGDKLFDVIKRRHSDPSFLFALPDVILSHHYTRNTPLGDLIDKKLGGIKLTWYERDSITDNRAMRADLFPWIRAARQHDIVFIANKDLEPIYQYIPYKYFIGVSSPDLHMEEGGVEQAAEKAITYGRPGVYFVSAGISSALIIDKLHGKIHNSFFIDTGSIWDAFVGIGGQREWRAKLYKDPVAWEAWKEKCLNG